MKYKSELIEELKKPLWWGLLKNRLQDNHLGGVRRYFKL